MRLSIAFAVLSLLACGRNDTPPPPGVEGGPCYGNGTCDADLVCSSGLCVNPDLCAEVDCSGHGTCVMEELRPVCQCDHEFHAVGLTCVPGCPASGCTQCADDMVLIAAQSTCIDRYEATVFQNPDCSGARYGGAGWDDFPPGFPDLVASPGCTGSCAGSAVVEPTIELYACSVTNIIPTIEITWFQARRACHNAGKRLCSHLEWKSACQGPNASTFPYGDTFISDRCNGGNPDGIVRTGERSACEGGYPALFDMSGNVNEWLDHQVTPGYYSIAGGDFGSYGEDELDCHLSDQGGVADSTNYLGFRCCK